MEHCCSVRASAFGAARRKSTWCQQIIPLRTILTLQLQRGRQKQKSVWRKIHQISKYLGCCIHAGLVNKKEKKPLFTGVYSLRAPRGTGSSCPPFTPPPCSHMCSARLLADWIEIHPLLRPPNGRLSALFFVTLTLRNAPPCDR